MISKSHSNALNFYTSLRRKVGDAEDGLDSDIVSVVFGG
jgi:hypothetical protein